MGLYVDGIDERDITDLRNNANKKSTLDILKETKERLKVNSYRTKEKINYTYIGRKQGVVVDLGVDGSTDDFRTYAPSVILDGTTYKMWYGGYDGGRIRIHYATSTDGITWDKQGVVVDVGASGETDDFHTYAPCVILDGTTYKMWYTGYDGSHWRIHYATSTDGITWDKQGVVVDLGADGSTDDTHTHTPSVILDGTTYKMWYTGNDSSHSRIHYATSTDGITWDKQGVVLDLGVNGSTDDYHVEVSSVILDGTTYKMWYSGSDGGHWRIHYATSTDGITWYKQGVVVNIGASGETDDFHTYAPSVILDGTTYKMWYSGYDGNRWRIHYAELKNMDITSNYNYIYNIMPKNELETRDILLPTDRNNASNNNTTVLGETNNGYFLSLGWSNVKHSLKYTGKTVTLSRSFISVEKVLITDKNNNILEATYTTNVAYNSITITNPYNTLNYVDDEDMENNVSILVYYKAKTKIETSYILNKVEADDKVVTVTGNSQYQILTEGLLNQPQTSTSSIACKDFNVLIDNKDSKPTFPNLKHEDITGIIPNNYSGTMLKFNTYLINAGYRATLNIMYQEVTYFNGGNNVHTAVDSGLIFSNAGDTIYKYGVVVDLGVDGETDDFRTYAPSVILDGTTYKMWYSGYDGTHNRIHYATSTDGITWYKQGVVVDIGASGETDDFHTYAPSVILDGTTYKMWYAGHDGTRYRIHYATSTDGITWDKQGVVVDLGADGETDDYHVYTPCVILDGTTYKMWYAGNDGGHIRIHYATSTDGITWDKQGVVVDIGASGETDDFHTYAPSVILDGTTYKMWYSGYDGNRWRIHYATSTDGITWDKQGVVVDLGVNGETDDFHTYAPSVILDGTTYKMWYAGYDGGRVRIHYATTELLDIGEPTRWVDDQNLSANNAKTFIKDVVDNTINKGVVSLSTPYIID